MISAIREQVMLDGGARVTKTQALSWTQTNFTSGNAYEILVQQQGDVKHVVHVIATSALTACDVAETWTNPVNKQGKRKHFFLYEAHQL